MKHLLTLLAMLFSLASFAQSNIYNPDSDDDGLITSEDLLIFLSSFGTNFSPNPCNCGCYANPYFTEYPIGDTISAYEAATNIFIEQPDSLKFDFVVAPYGTGSMPFNNSDTLFYDTLTFTQTYPFNYLDNDGASAPYSNATENYSGYGSGVAFMQYRYQADGTNDGSYFYYQISTDAVHGGVDIVDSDYPFHIEGASICPNMLNDELWLIDEDVEFFQIEDGVYINVFELASSHIPIEPSEEYPTTWFIHYPLNWVVITEIFNDPSE